MSTSEHHQGSIINNLHILILTDLLFIKQLCQMSQRIQPESTELWQWRIQNFPLGHRPRRGGGTITRHGFV